MTAVHSPWQPRVQSRIEEILAAFFVSAQRHQLDPQKFDYLTRLSVKGKQFRGCLMLDFYASLGNASLIEQAIDVAVAIELYGTALLIHDDIMDRADQRRSMSTAHVFFADLAKKTNLTDPLQFGQGSAICLGDVLFFVADKSIAQSQLPAELRLKLITASANELALLGLAQVEDLRLSHTTTGVSKNDILAMYVGKTGRYTGRWPLELACILAGIDEETTSLVSSVGEKIGLLYQLRDDELGLFGDEAETGKSATSDITEGKKTLYYLYLEQTLKDKEKREVFSIIGKQSAQDDEIKLVKQVIEEHGIRTLVSDEISALRTEITSSIAILNIPTNAQAFLNHVLEFVVTRTK